MKTLLRPSALAALTTFPLVIGAAGPGADYNAFLRQIAVDCKPLIIGRDNIGQAILNNGMGADIDNYHKFLSYTARVYRGALSEPDYRRALTAFLGAGTYNSRSLDCIASHLPAAPADRKP